MNTKKLSVIALLCVIALGAFSDVIILMREYHVTNSDAAVPVRISTTNLYFKTATIYGKKAARTDNTGTVYIGLASTNNTQFVAIPAGGSVVIPVDGDYVYDFKDFWLDVSTADDGVMITYSYR